MGPGFMSIMSSVFTIVDVAKVTAADDSRQHLVDQTDPLTDISIIQDGLMCD